MAKYQNKDVTVVRSQGKDMVIIKGEDGKERAVPRNQVTGAEAQDQDQAEAQSGIKTDEQGQPINQGPPTNQGQSGQSQT